VAVLSQVDTAIADDETMVNRSSRRLRFVRRRAPMLIRLNRAATRIRIGLLLLIGLCLMLSLRCLDLIGPPPRVRIDALWVNSHAYLVRVLLVALAVAAIASGMLLFSRRGLAAAIVLWVVAAIVAVWHFDDRLWIIFRVLVRQV
jgi:hypothetical protein